MADRPIIFSAPMVQALLAGRKTQTRRVLKPQPFAEVAGFQRVFCEPPFYEAVDAAGKPVVQAFPYPKGFVSPYPRLPYAPGDRLWVREAWSGSYAMSFVKPKDRAPFTAVWWWADGNPPHGDWEKPRPSIHMPRWASRLTLHVTEVRVQRLQEITAEDCTAEGIPFEADALAPYEWSVSRFADLWNSLHGADAWDANPWICAITFTVERANIDEARRA